MRQAGRYLPEYRALKERHGFLGLMTDPALAAEVTLQPIRRFPLDGAILFSDIMTPLLGMGVGLSFDPGPVIPSPLRTRAAVEALRPLDPLRDCGFVAETLRRVKPSLPPGVALLGFAGSPFTVASYLVEGGGGKGEARAIRRLRHADPGTLRLLLDRLADATVAYLRMQVEAGADAVQVFDTWGALLGEEEYRDADLPSLRKVIDGARATGVPVILYCGGPAAGFRAAAESGADCLSVDHRTGLAAVRAAAGRPVAVQGNLDPCALFAPEDRIRAATERVLREGGGRGHVFNLGHGIQEDTPIAAVEAMLAAVAAVGPEVAAGASP
jgi:uroporphyrinogen decarboxylase